MRFTTITCTSDRPEAFALCEKYLIRQTLKPHQMLVMDDGIEPAKCTIGQEHYYSPEFRGPGSMVNKLRMALMAGIVKGDAIAFIEDDDHVDATWLEWCAKHLEKYEIVGEGNMIYYNVAHRWWFQHRNTKHASLCATAIRRSGFETLLLECRSSHDAFLDDRLWPAMKGRGAVIPPGNNPLVIGIKEMPGKKGYSQAHHKRDRAAIDDPTLSRLSQLIGDDAQEYAKFKKPSERR